jgi:hypothetical protein
MSQNDGGGRSFNLYPFYPYSDRPKLSWPNDARIAFWVASNIESYERDPPPNPGRPAWPTPRPDTMNYSWHDDASRVGV